MCGTTNFNIHSVAKCQKTLERPFETLKSLEKKRQLRVLNSVTVPKKVKRDHLGFFNINSIAKYQQTLKGNFLETLKCFEKISQSRKRRNVS